MSDLRGLVHEILAQPPALVTDEDIENYVVKLQSVIDASIVEALNGASATPKDTKSPLESTSLPPATLMEQLAAIEHERWADWQKYCHSVLRNAPILKLSQEDILVRWDRQINTPYSELTEKEKQSDRDQVARYWKLIDEYIAALSRGQRG